MSSSYYLRSPFTPQYRPRHFRLSLLLCFFFSLHYFPCDLFALTEISMLLSTREERWFLTSRLIRVASPLDKCLFLTLRVAGVLHRRQFIFHLPPKLTSLSYDIEASVISLYFYLSLKYPLPEYFNLDWLISAVNKKLISLYKTPVAHGGIIVTRDPNFYRTSKF